MCRVRHTDAHSGRSAPSRDPNAKRAARSRGRVADRQAPDHAAPVRRRDGSSRRDPHRCIGRGHAGKTALFQVLGECLVGDFLPSGLHLDASDPREVARMIREAEEAQRLLQESGLPPTLQVSQTRYCILQGRPAPRSSAACAR